jgi:hypothetical protein
MVMIAVLEIVFDATPPPQPRALARTHGQRMALGKYRHVL